MRGAFLVGAAVVWIACGEGFVASEEASSTDGGRCQALTDCSVPSSPCVQAACVAGRCALRAREKGRLPESLQQSGDCAALACDGKGNVLDEVDPGDIPDDGNACTEDWCEGGAAVNAPTPFAPCGSDLRCDEAGVCVGCVDSSDCPDPGPCAKAICHDGQCGLDYLSEGTPVPSQIDGDCRKVVCNGQGGTVDVPDDGDAPTTLDCMASACVQGMPQLEPLLDGTACGSNLAQECCSGVCCGELESCQAGSCY